MTQVNLPVSSSAVPWPTSDDRDRSSSGAMLPVQKQTHPAAASATTRAAMEAHNTRDFVAARVAPAASQMHDGLAAVDAEGTATPRQPIKTRKGWWVGVRNTVSSSPMISVALALALGAALVRIAR